MTLLPGNCSRACLTSLGLHFCTCQMGIQQWCELLQLLTYRQWWLIKNLRSFGWEVHLISRIMESSERLKKVRVMSVCRMEALWSKELPTTVSTVPDTSYSIDVHQTRHADMTQNMNRSTANSVITRCTRKTATRALQEVNLCFLYIMKNTIFNKETSLF